jgi:hypothetical protein
MRHSISAGIVVAAALGTGCSKSAPPASPDPSGPESRTVRLHVDGFKKSRSGAV